MMLQSLALLCAVIGLSEGFVRYGLVSNVVKSAYDANAACVSAGYDGLAVIDTALKWDFAKVLITYDNVPTNKKMWIGLKRNVMTNEFMWRGDKVFTWGKWAAGAPAATNTQVVIFHNGVEWVWNTEGGNYEHWMLCDTQSNSMKMSLHPNKNINLSSVTPLMTQTATSHEDCAMLCSSVSACKHLTSDLTAHSCKLYDSSAAAQLSIDSGVPSSFNFYTVAA